MGGKLRLTAAIVRPGGRLRRKTGLRGVVVACADGYNLWFAILPNRLKLSSDLAFTNWHDPLQDIPLMRFWLLDRICSFDAGKQLTAIKNVSLAEEYLADHFPEFPVLPGVFMLEAATQAGAWLVRLSENYAHSIVTLHEARAVKYADFVTPGQMLTMSVEQTDSDERYVKMKFQGAVEGRVSVSGRIILERYNLADENPAQAGLDSRMIAYQRSNEALLTRGTDVVAIAT